jgi:hypothetical protein
MQVVTADEARERRIYLSEGIGNVVYNDYWGEPPVVGTISNEPQAFLVNLVDPNAALFVHFHDVDQFQIGVGGGGKIGVHEMGPVTVHYADAYTAYGPIKAGSEGLSFFTIRMAGAGGGWRMPGSRHLMPTRKPGRNLTARLDLSKPAPSPGTAELEYLLPPHDDGLAVAAVRLGPEAQLDPPESDSGRCMLVCSGALMHEGKMLPRNSLMRIEADDRPPSLVAASGGAVVLVMQFPRPSDRPGSDPRRMGDRTGTYASPIKHMPA